MSRTTVVIAGLLGAIGVVIGAIAAHGLDSMLEKQGVEAVEIAKKVDQCNTAVRYHMLHVLVILSIGLSAGLTKPSLRRAATACLFIGIALFSGGLYSMGFLDQTGHWAIVPTGGLFFIIGWLLISTMAIGSPGKPRDE